MVVVQTNRPKNDEDDVLSYCGSISGETFSSRRRRNKNCSLGHHSVDSLARRLREHQFDDGLPPAAATNKKRFNKSFNHYRILVVMFGGFSVGIMFLLRYNITVSILRMVNQTHLYMEEHPDRTVDDFIAEGYTVGGEFNWNNEIQHMIMSWYMVAYTLPQVPTTKLSTMLGARLAIPLSLSLCGISTLLTPMFAYFGWQWVIFLRLINGLGASAVLPMLLYLVEGWMPYNEITLGLTIGQAIIAVVMASNPIVSGYLSAIHWSYSFYVPGAVTVVFCILWLILITDKPEENFFISEKELDHICSCSRRSSTTDDKNKSAEITDGKTTDTKEQRVVAINQQNEDDLIYKANSWTDIFKVPAFYAYIMIWCCYCSSYSGFSFVLPTYLRQFLKIQVAQNGIYCSIIQSGCMIGATWPHPFLRILQNKFKLSITASRRITHFILCSVVALTWIYVGTFHEAQILMLFLNRCAQNSNDIVVTGCLMSNFAKAGLSSLAFSMVNTVGNLSVVFSSTFIGWLLDYRGQDRQAWSWIFDGLGVAQWVMFLLFITFINSDPIKFGKKPSKGVENGQMVDNMQVASDPKNKDNGALNNFEKLKNTQTNADDYGRNESKQI